MSFCCVGHCCSCNKTMILSFFPHFSLLLSLFLFSLQIPHEQQILNTNKISMNVLRSFSLSFSFYLFYASVVEASCFFLFLCSFLYLILIKEFLPRRQSHKRGRERARERLWSEVKCKEMECHCINLYQQLYNTSRIIFYNLTKLCELLRVPLSSATTSTSTTTKNHSTYTFIFGSFERVTYNISMMMLLGNEWKICMGFEPSPYWYLISDFLTNFFPWIFHIFD